MPLSNASRFLPLKSSATLKTPTSWSARVRCPDLSTVAVMGPVVDIIRPTVFLCRISTWERLSMSDLIVSATDSFGILKRPSANHLSGASICPSAMNRMHMAYFWQVQSLVISPSDVDICRLVFTAWSAAGSAQRFRSDDLRNTKWPFFFQHTFGRFRKRT